MQPSEASGFVNAIGDGNWALGIKLLDAALAACSQNTTRQALLGNRGVCNQKLQLFRKALKVGSTPPGSAPPLQMGQI
jgi:hypothetical protein